MLAADVSTITLARMKSLIWTGVILRRPCGTGSLFMLTGVAMLAADFSTLTLAVVKDLIWTGVACSGF
jgi:hypothetical protein